MGLSRYHAKRNFKITAEPRGKVGRGGEKRLSYVIQKHAASHLHYDFRLEVDGVLLSWAVPKGPSLDPADKRLAMHVEDHPLEYGDFEGTIPARQYGGGTVMVWDRGTWAPASDPRAAYKKGHLKFDLMGRKLKGRWDLIKTSGSKFGSGKSEAWLLIKHTDEFARRGVDARIVEAEPNSAVSKRSIEEIAAARDKRLLRKLAGTSLPRVRYSPDVQGAGAEVFKQACPHGFEGIVSKQADSAYTVGVRSRSWLKVKCSRRQEMVIGGFTDPQGGRVGFGALLLGVYDAGRLMYVGKVGTGFDDKALAKMRRTLEKLEQRTPSFTNPPRGAEAGGAHWVKPTLVGEVQFTEWSSSGALRHRSFLGLRSDKQATEVVREKPAADIEPAVSAAAKHPGATKRADLPAASERAKQPAAKRAKAGDSAGSEVAGVTLSHPDKLLFPEAKLSKLALAHYYEAVADWILPYLEGRPLSLVRCPDGWNKECFYQKNADKSVHAAVSRVEVPWSGGKATYFAANSVAALVGLVQWGVLELHPWGSHTPALERPDRLIFDFDPADDVAWPDLVKAVHLLRTLLAEIDLTGFLKTTGGKSLHVVVPIKATLTWPQAKGFTKAIADLLANTFPDRFTASMSKSKRGGRIFIDYLRNSEGATAIAAYSFRARSNAPVSTPIAWSELAKEVRFDFFNVSNVPARLKRLRKDP